jgi:hypothetical protein
MWTVYTRPTSESDFFLNVLKLEMVEPEILQMALEIFGLFLALNTIASNEFSSLARFWKDPSPNGPCWI